MVDGISWDELLEEAGDDAATMFEPIPAGDYDVEVVEAPHRKTKGSPAKDSWNVQFKIIGGAYNNRRVFDQLTISPESKGALRYFFGNMGALGLTQDFWKSKPTNEQVSSALKGRTTRIKVKHETYQGEIKERVEKYLRPAGGVSPQASAGATPPPAAATPPPPPAAAAPAAPPQAAPAPPPPPPAPEPVAEQPAAPAPAPAPAAPATPPPPPLSNLPF